MSIINVYAVRDENGLNKTATIEKFLKDYDLFAAKESQDMETIGKKVMEVLNSEKFSGLKSINMPALQSYTMNLLDVEPNAVAFVMKRIGDWVHSQPEKFHVGKGAGPLTGVRILSRLDAKEMADVQAQREKAAVKAAEKLAKLQKDAAANTTAPTA